MAIDTENKRRSVVALVLGIMLPITDGAIGQLDRQEVAWIYAGISSSPPSQISNHRIIYYMAD